jgi:hypothetical protein
MRRAKLCDNADLIGSSGIFRIRRCGSSDRRTRRIWRDGIGRATPIEGAMNMRKLTLTLVALLLTAGIAVVADARMAASRKADRSTTISIDPTGLKLRVAPLPSLQVIDDPF